MCLYSWLIRTIDRIAMAEDVARVFSVSGISLSSMEVYPYKIYVKFAAESAEAADALFNGLLNNPDVQGITTTTLQPFERKEKELTTILEATTNGIIGIDARGIITYFNPAIVEYLGITQKRAVGMTIFDLFKERNGAKIQRLLKGIAFDDCQMSTISNKGTIFSLCSGRPILNDHGESGGAVITMKSLDAMQRIATNVSNSLSFSFEDIICRSKVMIDLIAFAKRISSSRYTVLIQGETGTGKELFARAIHNASDRCHAPFAPINCAAIPEDLVESELFGYEAGAFSGAVKGGKIGLFESANKGSVFLDEFGELSLILQSKLLRVLQEGVIRRVGGTKEIPVDVRIIVATNRHLEQMIEKKQFRQDLYYRINVIPINIPALRERVADIPLLLNFFIKKYSQELNKSMILDESAKRQLQQYSWPGNVRELQNVILRAINLAADNLIKPEDLLLPTEHIIQSEPNREERQDQLAAEALDANLTLQQVERDLLKNYLMRYGSARKVAREMGISHTTVLNKARHYQLDYLLSHGAVKKQRR